MQHVTAGRGFRKAAELALLVTRTSVLEPHFNDALWQVELPRHFLGLLWIGIGVLNKVDVEHSLLGVSEARSHQFLLLCFLRSLLKIEKIKIIAWLGEFISNILVDQKI